MTVERPVPRNNTNELHKTISTGSLSLCSVSSDAVDLLPDVAFNIVGSSNEGTIDSTGSNRENEPLLSRDDIQPLNHIPGNEFDEAILTFPYGHSFKEKLVKIQVYHLFVDLIKVSNHSYFCIILHDFYALFDFFVMCILK